MANLWSVTYLAILGAVACVKETDYPPDGDVHPHNPNFDLEDYKDVVREQSLEAHNLLRVNFGQYRKFFKPYLRPFPYPIMHPVHHPVQEGTADEDSVEVNDSEELLNNDDNNTPLEEVQSYEESEAGSKENQEESEEDNQEDNNENYFEDTELNKFVGVESRLQVIKSFEVPCDFLTVPRYSCYTCYTYLVCKPNGGKVKSCSDRLEPYCNNGICSANPSPECVQNTTFSN